MIMNLLQENLRDWIVAGLQLKGLRNVDGKIKGELPYYFNNMIAKYSSASDSFWISIEAENVLKKERPDYLKNPQTRHHFSRGKYSYKVEHHIPANRVLGELFSLKEADITLPSVTAILDFPGPPCIILEMEDKRLREKFQNDMPDGWRWGMDRFARYNEVTPRILLSKMRVPLAEGRVYR